MSYKEIGLEFYARHNQCVALIPLHAWNKIGEAPKDKDGKPKIDKDGDIILGPQLGKAPWNKGWTKKEYALGDYKKWIKQGRNLGYRIPTNEVIIDMDPRNYFDEHDRPVDVETMILELFNADTMDDLSWDYPVCKTGGDGYHIYTTLPDGYDYRNLREVIKSLPGVEFKKHGKQVVCAGSRHPNSLDPDDKIYEYISSELVSIDQIPLALLDMIKVDKNLSNSDDPFRQVLSPEDLQEYALSLIDVMDFAEHDEWLGLMMACHYATGGEGCDEFIDWSVGDPDYEHDDHKIRQRWESLNDKPGALTERSLVWILKENGAAYRDLENLLDYGETLGNDNGEAAEYLADCEKAVDGDELDGIMPDKKEPTVEAGSAMAACKALKKSSSEDEIRQCLSLMIDAKDYEKAMCRELLVSTKILTAKAIKDREKAIEQELKDESDDAGGEDSIPEVVAKLALKNVFNKGQHIMTEPNGITYVFMKTHWREAGKPFLTMGAKRIVESLKKKYGLTLSMLEIDIAKKAADTLMIVNASFDPLLQDLALKPIINCLNCELHMHDDGTFTVKGHNPKHYLTDVLNVTYDVDAKCPTFDKTIAEVFDDCDDCDDMVRHYIEKMGYSLEVDKTIACWDICIGSGGDGKSMLLKIRGAILGKTQVHETVRILKLGNGSSDNHLSTILVGAKVVAIEETPANHLIPEAGVKLLSETTQMTADPKFGKLYPFTYSASLMICTNTTPVITEISEGTKRRISVIPFGKQFTAHGTADNTLVAKIVKDPKEMSGVLNRMLEGLKRVKQRGDFDTPTTCIKAKDDLMIQSNNVRRFVSEHIVRVKGKSIMKLDFFTRVYERYTDDCENNGVSPKTKPNFERDLEALALHVRVSGGHQKSVYGGQWIKKEILSDFDGMADNEGETMEGGKGEILGSVDSRDGIKWEGGKGEF